jgi:hypothetical protein
MASIPDRDYVTGLLDEPACGVWGFASACPPTKEASDDGYRNAAIPMIVEALAARDFRRVAHIALGAELALERRREDKRRAAAMREEQA